MNKKTVRRAFVDTVPVLAGYIVLGFGFGFLLKINGYGIFPATAMSLFIYAGSMQYAAVGLLAGGASLATVALTTIAVNARHLFYGISMLERYRDAGRMKPYLIFALTDETYSLVCGEKRQEGGKYYYFAVSLLNHLYWIAGTAIGSVVGSVVKFDSNGIDFALTALFLTIFIEQWLTEKNHRPAIIGVLTSVICLCLFGKDTFLIPTMLVISVVLCLYREEKAV